MGKKIQGRKVSAGFRFHENPNYALAMLVFSLILNNQFIYLHGRDEAVHVVSPVAVVAEEKFVVVLRGPAQRAGLALDTLPRVLAHAQHHVLRELQARRMP